MRKIILSLLVVFLSGNAFSQESFTNDIKNLLSQNNTSVESLKTTTQKSKNKLSKSKSKANNTATVATTKLEKETVEKSISYIKKNFTHQEVIAISKELSSNATSYSKKTNQFVNFWRITQAELQNKKRKLQK